MLRVETSPISDAVYIQLLDELIGYTEELDDDRLIDRALDSDEPVGIDLLSVSKGVKLDGLPEVEAVRKILVGLGLEVYWGDRG